MKVCGEVFIVWGGNYELAHALAQQLRELGYIAQVGGVDNDPSSSRFFLGEDVMQQLRRASRAIVLAQLTETRSFRPNLMFEWGMLAQRLPPAYLHVFLLGLHPEDLPTDVLGSWAETIDETDVLSAAHLIAERFTKRIRHEAAKPLDVLVEWQRWEAWLHQQADGETAPDNLMLAGVLIHSIQPSFYFGDQAELHEILRSIAKRPDIPLELVESLRIARAALSYYELTEHGVEQREKFFPIHAALADPVRTPIDALRTWMEIVRLNFLALTVKQIGDTSADPTQQRRWLTESEELFAQAAAHVEAFADPANAVGLLWRGYIRRNRGVVLVRLEREAEGREQLKMAIADRRNALATLSVVDPLLSTQLFLEVLYAQNDLARAGGDVPVWSLNDAIELLREHKPPAGRLGVWNRARRQLATLCAADAAHADLLKALERLS